MGRALPEQQLRNEEEEREYEKQRRKRGEEEGDGAGGAGCCHRHRGERVRRSERSRERQIYGEVGRRSYATVTSPSPSLPSPEPVVTEEDCWTEVRCGAGQRYRTDVGFHGESWKNHYYYG
ncbi:hypothetical protein PIB30_032792 [Stylosanthes scabra]|uniref:Uncharacterized protein n=1 Tax=Stylosanthes scabra TaxID=79078 RepID=A0ABU6WAR9_9FABA|nr:hypothetical protein [Stylosanthes scabra]